MGAVRWAHATPTKVVQFTVESDFMKNRRRASHFATSPDSPAFRWVALVGNRSLRVERPGFHPVAGVVEIHP